MDAETVSKIKKEVDRLEGRIVDLRDSRYDTRINAYMEAQIFLQSLLVGDEDE